MSKHGNMGKGTVTSKGAWQATGPKPRKPRVRLMRKLIRKARRGHELGKKHYVASGEALDQLIAMGAPVGVPIAMGDGTMMQITDLLADGQTGAFHATRFARYKLGEYKVPRKPGKVSAEDTEKHGKEGEV